MIDKCFKRCILLQCSELLNEFYSNTTKNSGIRSLNAYNCDCIPCDLKSTILPWVFFFCLKCPLKSSNIVVRIKINWHALLGNHCRVTLCEVCPYKASESHDIFERVLLSRRVCLYPSTLSFFPSMSRRLLLHPLLPP